MAASSLPFFFVPYLLQSYENLCRNTNLSGQIFVARIFNLPKTARSFLRHVHLMAAFVRARCSAVPCRSRHSTLRRVLEYFAASTIRLSARHPLICRNGKPGKGGDVSLHKGIFLNHYHLGHPHPHKKTGRPVTETKASTWRKSTKATARPHRQCPLPSINKRKKHWGTQKTFVILSRISKPE